MSSWKTAEIVRMLDVGYTSSGVTNHLGALGHITTGALRLVPFMITMSIITAWALALWLLDFFDFVNSM